MPNERAVPVSMLGEIGGIVGSSFERAPWGWGVFVVVLTTAIKGWPAIVDATSRARQALLDRRETKQVSLGDRIAALEKKVEEASTAAHTAEMKLVYAVSAVQLLAAKIRTDNPDDPTLKQAMELLSAATSGGLPGWGAKLASQLEQVKGAGE